MQKLRLLWAKSSQRPPLYSKPHKVKWCWAYGRRLLGFQLLRYCKGTPPPALLFWPLCAPGLESLEKRRPSSHRPSGCAFRRLARSAPRTRCLPSCSRAPRRSQCNAALAGALDVVCAFVRGFWGPAAAVSGTLSNSQAKIQCTCTVLALFASSAVLPVLRML